LPKLSEALKSYLVYEFIAVGILWVVAAVYVDRAVVLWPALTCIAAGALLKLWPSGRLSWAWASASALLGFMVSGYQVYVALPLISGVFSTVAVESLVAFAVFAVAHIVLFYTGYSPAATKPQGQAQV